MENKRSNHSSQNNNSFFDNPKNVKRILIIFYVCCAFLFVLDFVIHRHVIHSWEDLWGFYPIFGFVSCVLLVLVAKKMRALLMRSEDYYKTQQEVSKEQNDKPGGQDVDA